MREAMLRINGTSDGGASYLQLLEPTRGQFAVGKWLAKNGEGVHHIAFGTADVDSDSEAMRDKGVRVLYDEPRTGSMGSRITFLHPKDCHGVLTELVTSASEHLTLRHSRPGTSGRAPGRGRAGAAPPAVDLTPFPGGPFAARRCSLGELRPGDGWDRAVRGYERQESHRADDDHLSRFEAEMDRLKTEREKAVQHAEDLGYQVEVLRAKLHEARRTLAPGPPTTPQTSATRPNSCSATPRSRPTSCARTPSASCARRAPRPSASSRSTPSTRPGSRRSCTPRRSPRRQRLDQELSERRQTVESHVNENVAWAEQLRARTESQARRLLDESRAEAEQALAAARAEAAAGRRARPGSGWWRRPRRPVREAETILLRARTGRRAAAERRVRAGAGGQRATPSSCVRPPPPSPTRHASRPPS